MKSEHRHELKTNDLERIASGVRRVSEGYAQQHTNQLIIAIAAVIALGIVLAIWLNSGSSKDREAWRALGAANSAADFANVADKYAGTNVAQWARLREGEAHFYSGMHLMFSDRDAGRSDLKKAEECFDKLVSDKSTRDDVLERALFDLAGCRETLSGKNTDAAIETYERLQKRFPGSIYQGSVDGRIAALRTGSAEDFYAWFQAQNPKPRDREIPSDVAIPSAPSAPVKTIPSGESKAEPSKKNPPAAKGASDKAAGPSLPAPAVPAKTNGKSVPAPSGR